MTTGIIFDIREFAVHDGPGIRTTVFLKGCPLACQWCHNPEGQSRRPQAMHSPTVSRTAGQAYTPEALAAILNRQAAILRDNEGGVTFSGGEPLLQADFVAEVIDRLQGIHVLLDTCGYGRASAFGRLLERSQLVYYDLKLIDRLAHKHYTGCYNDRILANLRLLAASGVPYVIRVPLVPGVTDTDENLAAIAELVAGLPRLPALPEVHLLPYNRAAGAKYAAAGMQFKPEYDQTAALNTNTMPFEAEGIKVKVL